MTRYAAVLVSLALGLAGCAGEGASPTPTFYTDLGRPGSEVNVAAAATMINAYRAHHDAPALQIDPTLTRVANDRAKAMATADSVKVSLKNGDTARERLDSTGYAKGPVVENVSAGYRRIAEAFSGWRDSPQHNANMLDKRMTKIGLATAYSSKSKYKVFWSLVLAGPQE